LATLTSIASDHFCLAILSIIFNLSWLIFQKECVHIQEIIFPYPKKASIRSKISALAFSNIFEGASGVGDQFKGQTINVTDLCFGMIFLLDWNEMN
jgi:hypothetical protein